MFRLARERFPKMPLFPGHPTFEVVSYRTPHGSRVTGDHHWGLPNDACLGYMSELVIGTTHTGAHIDAHAHMTVGGEDRWHGGSARTDLGDFGPVSGDAPEIPPLWRRGVLYDVPGHRGVEALAAGEPSARTSCWPIEAATGVAAGAGDVALVRTGYLSGWPDPERLAASRGAGPDISAARLLCGARRRRHRLGHRDLRGAARARPRRAREPAARAHAAADRARRLPAREPRPRGARRRGRARVPVRRPAARHPRGDRDRWSTRSPSRDPYGLGSTTSRRGPRAACARTPRAGRRSRTRRRGSRRGGSGTRSPAGRAARRWPPPCGR